MQKDKSEQDETHSSSDFFEYYFPCFVFIFDRIIHTTYRPLSLFILSWFNHIRERYFFLIPKMKMRLKNQFWLISPINYRALLAAFFYGLLSQSLFCVISKITLLILSKSVIYKKNNNFYFVILYAMEFLNNVFYSFLIITLSLSTVRR